MDKEKLLGLKAEQDQLKTELAKATEDELWDAVSALAEEVARLDDQISELESEIEEIESEIEALAPEDEKSFWSNAGAVAKSKGLPELDGRVAKHIIGASIARSSVEKLAGLDIGKARTKVKRKPEDYRPTPEQLAKINKFANTDMDEKSVYVFTTLACDQEQDRHVEMLRPKALQSGCKMCPDSPIQTDHSMSVEDSVGKIFDAKVYKKALYQSFYIEDVPENQALLRKMFSGIINKTSVHFSMSAKDYVCSSCNKSMYSMECSHWPGGTDEKGQLVVAYIMDMADYYETSLVSVPAQPKAGFRRGTQSGDEDSEKSLDSKPESLDKILNEKRLTQGDDPVDPNLESTPSAEDVKPPVTEVEGQKSSETNTEETAPETPATPAAEPNIDVEALKASVSELKEAVETLANMVKSLVEANVKSAGCLKALVEASNKQSELVTKATNTIDERFEPKSVEVVEPKEEAKAYVDMTQPGGLLNGIFKSLDNK